MPDLIFSYTGRPNEVGCDEAGRGCLAGPVVAAAVVFNNFVEIKELNDSKKLTETQRLKLRDEIIKKASFYSIAVIDNIIIDEINILNASILAIHKAIEQIKINPEFIIVDGNRFKPFKNIPHKTIIKGDATYFSIAAASILAKTYRDELMKKYHKEFPHYNWEQNKGYPTLEHKLAIQKYGLTPLHRKTFSHHIQLKLF